MIDRVRMFVASPFGGTVLQFSLLGLSLILGLAQIPGATIPIWILLLLSVLAMYQLMKLEKANPGISDASRDDYVRQLTHFINENFPDEEDPNIQRVLFALLDANSIRQALIVQLTQEALNQIQRNEANPGIRSEGIVIAGWWCLYPTANGVACDTFNGEEKQKHTECRRCGHPKANPRISSESTA